MLDVLYECPDESLQSLNEMEAYGHGYDRIEVNVEASGKTYTAFTYVGMPQFQASIGFLRADTPRAL